MLCSLHSIKVALDILPGNSGNVSFVINQLVNPYYLRLTCKQVNFTHLLLDKSVLQYGI